jgi:hypothetical protein
MTNAIANTMPNDVTNAASSGDWRNAVNALVTHKIENGLPFSSGELAAELRTQFPSLRFSVTGLGDHVRDLFYGGGMDLYDDGMGGLIPPCQIPRTTQGLGRTPAGQMVFVYGPDQQTCDNHPFEVDIPIPGNQNTSQNAISTPKPSALPAAQPVGALPGGTQPPAQDGYTRTPVQITGQAAPRAIPKASVHTDRRLCVPRGAFEAFVLTLNHVMRGGDPVYIRFDGDTLIVTLDPQPGTSKYDLAVTRGRVLVTHPSTPFQPGDKYTIEVDGDELKVDLSQSV